MLIQRFRAELYVPSMQVCLGGDTRELTFPLLPCAHLGTERAASAATTPPTRSRQCLQGRADLRDNSTPFAATGTQSVRAEATVTVTVAPQKPKRRII